MRSTLAELEVMYQGIDASNIQRASQFISKFYRNKVVGVGAGRMGYALKAFVMRLSHIGYDAYMFGDTGTPRIGRGDLLIVNSSSGETPSVKLMCEIAKSHDADIFAVTCSQSSSIASYADLLLQIPTIESKQPMKTIYEQFTFLLFDFLASQIVSELKIRDEFLEQNHSILE